MARKMNTLELNSQLETNDLADELSDEALDREDSQKAFGCGTKFD
jgi:hypothetical protein